MLENFNRVLNCKSFFHIIGRIFSCANVEVDDLVLCGEKPDKVEQKAEPFDPIIDKDYPKLTLNGGRVSQPENENVLLQESKKTWQRSNGKSTMFDIYGV